MQHHNVRTFNKINTHPTFVLTQNQKALIPTSFTDHNFCVCVVATQGMGEWGGGSLQMAWLVLISTFCRNNHSGLTHTEKQWINSSVKQARIWHGSKRAALTSVCKILVSHSEASCRRSSFSGRPVELTRSWNPWVGLLLKLSSTPMR